MKIVQIALITQKGNVFKVKMQIDEVVNESKEEVKERDWEEVRINAAIATMQSLLNNPQYENKSIIAIADMSVSMADVLVKKLKGE